MNPHQHEWLISHDFGAEGPPVITRECSACGEVQRSSSATGLHGDRAWVNEVNKLSVGHGSRLIDGGGVKDYNPGTDMITLADGGSFSFEYLLRHNPGLSPKKLEEMLYRAVPQPGVAQQARVVAKELEGMAAASRMTTLSAEALKDLADTFVKMGEAFEGVSGNPSKPQKKWTSEDALTLILEEIKHDSDPLAAAGRWLTKITTRITDITRELGDDDG